jgi:hypothetical protein
MLDNELTNAMITLLMHTFSSQIVGLVAMVTVMDIPELDSGQNSFGNGGSTAPTEKMTHLNKKVER